MKKILAILIVVSALLPSCKNWLEEVQVSTLSYGYYDSEAGCEALINACYESLRSYSGDEWSYALFDYGTDEYMKGYEWTQPYAQPMYNDYTPDMDGSDNDGYPDIGDFWALIYNGIDRCNVAIDKIGRLEDARAFLSTPEGKNTRIAEAKFLRALHYFKLVQQFGSLPFTLEPSSGLEVIWPRVEAKVVYDSIVADLDWAYLNIPEEQLQTGRVDKDVVRHYLAKVLLTRSYAIDPGDAETAEDYSMNYDLGGNPTEDLARAATLIEEIETGGRHSLMDDYSYLWLEENDDNEAIVNSNTEVIFAVQFNDVDGLNGTNGSAYKNALHMYWFNQYDVDTDYGMTRNLEYGRPFRRLMMTEYTVNIFDRLNDSRLRKSLLEVHYANNPDATSVPKWTTEELLFAFDDVAADGSWAIRYGDTIRAGEYKYAAATASDIADRVNLGDTALVFLLNDGTTTLTDRDMIAAGYKIYARYYWRTEGGVPVELITYDRDDDLLEVSGILVEGSSVLESATWNRNKSPSLIKYWDRLKPGGYNSSVGTRDVVFARLAETYLLAAEIAIRQHDYTKAVDYINLVRRRAAYHEGEEKTSYWLKYDGGSMADLTSSTESAMEIDVDYLTGSSTPDAAWYPAGLASDEDRALAFLLNERCRELLGEMHRWEDLKRTNTLVDRAYAFNNDVRTYNSLQKFHRLRPIPIIHLDAIKTQDGDVIRPLTASEKQDYQNEGYN